MNEATIVAKIKVELRKQLSKAVVLKLQDYNTSGIPDLVVNHARRVTYVEVKLLKSKETKSSFDKHFDKLQLATLRLLEQQARAYYFAAWPGPTGKLLAIIASPERVAQFLDGQFHFNNFLVMGEFMGEIGPALDHLVSRVRGTP